MKLTIAFLGLCGIKAYDTRTEVFLHPGQMPANNDDAHGQSQASGAHLHEAIIAGRLNNVDVNVDGFWKPDTIYMNEDGHVIGVWSVPPSTLVALANGGGAPSRQPDNTVITPLRLRNEAGVSTKSLMIAMGSVRGLSAFVLPGGSLGYSGKVDHLCAIYKKQHDVGPFTAARTWEATEHKYIELGSQHGIIRFTDDSALTVSNIARAAAEDALRHINHLYDLLTTNVSEDGRMKLERSHPPTGLYETVYDCVPPVDLP